MRHAISPDSILDYLHRRGVRLVCENGHLECRSAADTLTPDVVRLITCYKQPLLAALEHKAADGTTDKQPPDCSYKCRIVTARDWEDLHRELQEVEEAYHQGRLTQDEAEELVFLAIRIGQDRPPILDSLKLEHLT